MSQIACSCISNVVEHRGFGGGGKSKLFVEAQAKTLMLAKGKTQNNTYYPAQSFIMDI